MPDRPSGDRPTREPLARDQVSGDQPSNEQPPGEQPPRDRGLRDRALRTARNYGTRRQGGRDDDAREQGEWLATLRSDGDPQLDRPTSDPARQPDVPTGRKSSGRRSGHGDGEYANDRFGHDQEEHSGAQPDGYGGYEAAYGGTNTGGGTYGGGTYGGGNYSGASYEGGSYDGRYAPEDDERAGAWDEAMSDEPSEYGHRRGRTYDGGYSDGDPNWR